MNYPRILDEYGIFARCSHFEFLDLRLIGQVRYADRLLVREIVERIPDCGQHFPRRCELQLQRMAILTFHRKLVKLLRQNHTLHRELFMPFSHSCKIGITLLGDKVFRKSDLPQLSTTLRCQ